MKPKKQFSPQNLRALLSVVLVLVVLGGGALFYWGMGLIKAYAIEVDPPHHRRRGKPAADQSATNPTSRNSTEQFAY